ncbi:hypothetical protein [Pseudonocardia abyssalis]|uniref:Anti-sigma-M factor RsmA n=1 Tax=Pseudonocardia abyssalis TaxID=2792008 RepID=A0ABS6UYG0_9PSEU|nr:hypothetical protein [Pseudonocardia abyssalis]MBW0114226.1 hypothetical protein [Pseudonocardia abyssalis]MBW0137300.1 hypothetical protein [Pseudonocardia abyssalis]
MTDPDAPDVELLADLDAGLLAPARADEVRRAAVADPRCAAVLDALAATRADLAAVPTPPVPSGLRRWTAPGGPSDSHRGIPGPGRSRPRHPRTRPGSGHRARWVLAAAAAAVVALLCGVPASGPDAALDVSRVELAAVARSTVGLTDLGDLTDPARRDACLRDAGLPGAAVLGGRQVRLEGTPGVLLVLSTGELGRIRVLVVSPSCAVLDDTVVGGP